MSSTKLFASYINLIEFILILINRTEWEYVLLKKIQPTIHNIKMISQKTIIRNNIKHNGPEPKVYTFLIIDYYWHVLLWLIHPCKPFSRLYYDN